MSPDAPDMCTRSITHVAPTGDPAPPREASRPQANPHHGTRKGMPGGHEADEIHGHLEESSTSWRRARAKTLAQLMTRSGA